MKVNNLEKLYNEIWRDIINLRVCTVPFMWKSIDSMWVVSVDIWDLYKDRITDELLPYAIDDLYGIEGYTLVEALERFRDELLPVLRRFKRKIIGE